MLELSPENTADYLRRAGRVPDGASVSVRALGWGVSNVVLKVEVQGAAPFVLKQSRERLRVEMDWVSRLDRIWTERDTIRLLGQVLPEGTVPQVLFDDGPNYLFAMTCAPADAVVWKERLLACDAKPAVARRAGEVLGTVHASTRGHPALAGRLANLEVFDQLRIDPFYRTAARAHPDLAPALDALAVSTEKVPIAERCLVLGDFSPKNILVHSGGGGLTLVDFETAHAGDPAYDVGFFLSHLLLKALRGWRIGGVGFAVPIFDLMAAFQGAYEPIAGRPGLETRAAAHAVGCLLARVDGKSPVDYLDESGRDAARRLARAAFAAGPLGLDALVVQTARLMQASDDG